MPKPNKRQEKFCVQECADHIARQKPGATVSFQPEDNDPPDFWLWINGERYAAEVTRIRDEKEMTRTMSLWRIVEDVQTDALRTEKLGGRYTVEFQHGLSSGRERRIVRTQIMGYLAKTLGVPNPPPTDIRVAGRVIAQMKKHASDGAAIDPVGNEDNGGGFPAEIEAELNDLLRRSITSKAQKMAKICGPAVLILYDLYRFASDRVFRQCLLAIPEIARFEYVYVVRGIGEGFGVPTRPRFFPSHLNWVTIYLSQGRILAPFSA